jgi:hypothetical protein
VWERGAERDSLWCACVRQVESLLRGFNRTSLPAFSRGSDMQWAYALTALAGSAMYLSPEVFRVSSLERANTRESRVRSVASSGTHVVLWSNSAHGHGSPLRRVSPITSLATCLGETPGVCAGGAHARGLSL